MKKIVFIMICCCLLLVGCGKKEEPKKEESKKEEITLELGNEDITFTEEKQTCGQYEIQSNVTFLSERDEDGNYIGSYAFYDCSEGNVNLETATGSYSVDGYIVTFTDTYGQQLEFELISNDTMEQKDGNETIRTMTK